MDFFGNDRIFSGKETERPLWGEKTDKMTEFEIPDGRLVGREGRGSFLSIFIKPKKYPKYFAKTP